ncbi:proline-rich extensin-like protein EPR1 [Gracilaria domingensis]|nr:proline-rich extensin-like protein EPR1 [Gracilaria domingensis]
MSGIGSPTCALQRSCCSLASEANFGVVRAADAKSVFLEASRNASSGRAKGRVAGWAGGFSLDLGGLCLPLRFGCGFAVGGCSDAVAAAVRCVRCVWATVEVSACREASISGCGGFLARDGRRRRVEVKAGAPFAQGHQAGVSATRNWRRRRHCHGDGNEQKAYRRRSAFVRSGNAAGAGAAIASVESRRATRACQAGWAARCTGWETAAVVGGSRRRPEWVTVHPWGRAGAARGGELGAEGTTAAELSTTKENELAPGALFWRALAPAAESRCKAVSAAGGVASCAGAAAARALAAGTSRMREVPGEARSPFQRQL